MSSKIRQELEEQREILHEKYQRNNFELSKQDDPKSAKYNFLASKKRKLTRDINLLTSKIDELKEIDEDPEVCKNMDVLYDRMNQLFDDAHNVDDNPIGKEIESIRKGIEELEDDSNINDIHIDDDIPGMVDDFLNDL